MRKQNSTSFDLGKFLISALLYVLIGFPSIAQRPFVREFRTAAILLATGDTVQSNVLLHWNQDVLEVRKTGQALLMIPAAAIRLFGASQEIVHQLSQEKGKAEKQNKGDELVFFDPTNKYAYARFNQPITPATAVTPVSAGAIPIYVREAQRQKRYRKQPYLYRMDSTRISIFRTFKLNKGLTSSVGAPAFFEQLTDGPVLLLRRQRIYNQLHDDLYIVQPNTAEMGTATQLHHPRKQLFTLFAAHSRQLKQYVKEKHIDFADTQSVVAFMAYANSLQPQQ